jgi:8-oxo-dGTP diphosphatase
MRGDTILLGKRGADPFRGFWALPGGYVERDESVEEAVAREVKEETGLEVTGVKLSGVYSKPDRHPKQAVVIVYAVEAEGEARSGDDLQQVRFCPLDELPDLAFDHRTIIDDYLRQRSDAPFT